MNVPVIPENAPFEPQQRAWLNGFFAGMIGVNAGVATAVPQAAPAASPQAQSQPEEQAAPWHDPTMPIADRLKLSEGRARADALMSAMAQLDCGACGYLCKTYAEAIDKGDEKDLTRCAPGGSETAAKLREIMARPGGNVVSPAQVTVTRAAPVEAKESKTAYDRNHPYRAMLVESTALNGAGSVKDTRHVVIDLKGSGIAYKPGDALGVYPENPPEVVDELLARFRLGAEEEVPTPDGKVLHPRKMFARELNVSRPTRRFLELLNVCTTQRDERARVKAMLEGDAGAEGMDVIDLLRSLPSAKPSITQFMETLSPLAPRLYSISSSLRAFPEQVHLTVGVVRYVNKVGRACCGVASTYLAERVAPGQRVKVFVQPSHRFALPSDPTTPIIMVGPGTGIAPFRAFLQERKATGATGENWLFFGDQRRDCDFLYREEILGHVRDGTLARLDTAFSREQDEKVYVQHRMFENAKELWAWIDLGACFYVCGDAKRMAADVDAALKQIVAEQGRMSEEQAAAYVAEMTKTRRYQRDVY